MDRAVDVQSPYEVGDVGVDSDSDVDGGGAGDVGDVAQDPVSEVALSDLPDGDDVDGCVPAAEVCDGRDNDCDGNIDEGLERGCQGACGRGLEVCVAGVWVGCDAPQGEPEVCDGQDNDCDGAEDEDLTRDCSTACGAGVEVCRGGEWLECTARAPAREECNGRDDDCDGDVDEGLPVRIVEVDVDELREEQPECLGDGRPLDHCLTTADRYCRRLGDGCHPAGAGWIRVDGGSAEIVCLPRDGSRRSVTYAQLEAGAGFAVDDALFGTRQGLQAVNRYCRSEGFAAGVGPLEHVAPDAVIYCLNAGAAEALDAPTTELRARGCEPNAFDRHTVRCATATHDVCLSMGFAAGFGPLEWTPAATTILCFR